MPEHRARPAELLAELERLPLLGQGRVRARQLLAELAVASQDEPALDEAVSRHAGLLALAEQRPGAVQHLARAARLAAARGDRPAEVLGRLRVARALAAAGRAPTAERLLEEVAAEATGPACEPEALLLRAALHRGDHRAGLERLLGLLPSPARDHDRLYALRELAALLLEGGGPHAARAHLGEALALARHHRDAVQVTELALGLGSLLVEAGLPAEAEPLLAEALEGAAGLEDSLVQVAAGSVLAALRLARGDWVGAAEAAELQRDAAFARHNWLAVADATLTLSTCLLQADEPRRAIELLLYTGSGLRREGAAGAVNLVKARLGELRAQLGPEVVDPLLRRR